MHALQGNDPHGNIHALNSVIEMINNIIISHNINVYPLSRYC